MSPRPETFSIKTKKQPHFWSNTQLIQEFFEEIVYWKRSPDFDVFLSLWYYRCYGFAIFAISWVIWCLGCKWVVDGDRYLMMSPSYRHWIVISIITDIGTLRRECLDHMIILSEKHLYDVLHEYIFEYYNVNRTHMSLDKDSPVHRPAQTEGKIKAKPILGGLHHVYSRVAWAGNTNQDHWANFKVSRRRSMSISKDLPMLIFWKWPSIAKVPIFSFQRVKFH